MRKWGMQVYLDAGSHVNLRDKPYYYCGIFTMYKLAHQLRAGLKAEADLEEAQQRFLQARKSLLAGDGGIVSTFYHPCEFVHKGFWDSVNFRNGANPPREQWRPPPAKTPEESKIAYSNFENYVRFMKRFPEVQFVTATEAARLYQDTSRGHKFKPPEIRSIAAKVKSDIDFQEHSGYALAASEVFALLNAYVAQRFVGQNVESLTLQPTPYGPSRWAIPVQETVTADGNQFGRTAIDVDDFLRKQERIPTDVWLGSRRVPPETYLLALAHTAIELLDGKPMPETVTLSPAKLASITHVAEDDPRLWGWIIFPRGFRAPAMMDLARRQAWTLKPAVFDSWQQ
jgi:hypothetical protein